MLVDHANAAATRGAWCRKTHDHSIETKLSRICCIHTPEDPHERRFSRTVLPKNRVDLRWCEIEVNPVESRDPTELFTDTSGSQPGVNRRGRHHDGSGGVV